MWRQRLPVIPNLAIMEGWRINSPFNSLNQINLCQKQILLL